MLAKKSWQEMDILNIQKEYFKEKGNKFKVVGLLWKMCRGYSHFGRKIATWTTKMPGYIMSS